MRAALKGPSRQKDPTILCSRIPVTQSRTRVPSACLARVANTSSSLSCSHGEYTGCVRFHHGGSWQSARKENALNAIGWLESIGFPVAWRLYALSFGAMLALAGLDMLGAVLAERALRERYAVAPEMSDLLGVICLITAADSPASIDRLVAAVSALAAARRPALAASPTSLRSAAAAIAPGPQALTPREAFFAPTRAVALWESAGAVAAEPVVPYPPGIPVLTPGEVIAPAKIDYLRAALSEGLHVCGPADPTLRTLRIVA
jgi:arginine decarboxylase